MSLSQSYKEQKIIKVKQIHGHYNLADSMTRTKLLLALKMIINSNCINISITKWVEQSSIKQVSIGI